MSQFTKQTGHGRMFQKGNGMQKHSSSQSHTFYWGARFHRQYPKVQALLNKQEKCKPNHDAYMGLCRLSPENFSTRCKYSVRFLES